MEGSTALFDVPGSQGPRFIVLLRENHRVVPPFTVSPRHVYEFIAGFVPGNPSGATYLPRLLGPLLSTTLPPVPSFLERTRRKENGRGARNPRFRKAEKTGVSRRRN